MDELNNVEQSTETETNQPVNWKKETFDWVFSIAVALIIAMLIRHFVFTLVKSRRSKHESYFDAWGYTFYNKAFL